jgi:hypothetical protein
MSGLVYSAIDGVVGVLISSSVYAVTHWRSTRNRERRTQDAWHAQANELDDRLTEQFKGRLADAYKRIDYLETRLDKCQSECQRLNKLLTRGHKDD